MTPVSDLRALESLLAFWAQAGVDLCLEEAPVDRLRRPEPRPAPAAAPILPEASRIRRAVTATGGSDDEAVAAIAAAVARAETLDALASVVAGLPQLAGAVPGRGAQDAPVLLVGGAPSADDRRGGAFSAGDVGRLTDRILAAGELAERTWLTTAALRPTAPGQPPAPAELALARPVLERTVAILRPRLLWLAGDTAVKALLGPGEPLTRRRGRWLEWTAGDGSTLPVICTFDPALLLRQPSAKRQTWRDILLLTERLDRPERPD